MIKVPDPSVPPRFYYVYVLLSQKDKGFYVGSTLDLKNRIRMHNEEKVNSTKSRAPFELVFYETYRNKYDAIRREDYLKSTKGKRTLRNMLKEYLSGIDKN